MTIPKSEVLKFIFVSGFVIYTLVFFLFSFIFFLILKEQGIAVPEFIRKEFFMLTKDAKTMLYAFYKEYKKRIKSHIPKCDARVFGSCDSVQENLFPSWHIEDIKDTMHELGRNNFLKNRCYDNTISYSLLTDYAIAVMENQKTETFLNVTDFIAKFIP